MIKLTKQNTLTSIFINHTCIISIEDIQNGSKLSLQAAGHLLVTETALEILALINQL